MPKNRFMGVVLLCGGLYLLWLALQVAERAHGDWYGQITSGDISDQGLLYIIAGLVLSFAGLTMTRRR
jgi:threonine/homoserine/homoserine lactone efflux protein